MISESAFLFQDVFWVKRHVSQGGEDLRPPRHDEKGNNESEKITYWVSRPRQQTFERGLDSDDR